MAVGNRPPPFRLASLMIRVETNAISKNDQ
jgi:hypothetical protein